jgi:methionine synthase I (cobalamin-dependent)
VGYNTPANYAAACQAWLNEGARIVGGCCATTPEHIVALRAIV